MNKEGDRERQYMNRIGVILDHLYGEGRPPAKVKQQEAPYDGGNKKTEGDFVNPQGVTEAPVRLNAAYYDLTEQQGGLTPVVGVTYLWVVRADDGHLIVGVEDPSQMPTAFGVDVRDVVRAMQARKKELGEEVPSDNVLDGLGHTTLAAKFTPSGEAVPGRGRIAGELAAHGAGWKINDHSGRYTSGRSEVLPLLINAAIAFQGHGIDVQYIQSKTAFQDQIKTFEEVLSTSKQAKL
jgi:hypothetical protein